jgi:hydrogenase-1 operon protein HyaF
MSSEAGARRLAAIGVAVETESGNIPLLLHELRHALEALVTDGKTHVVDLRAIPLAPGEEDRLLATLGEGELVAEFDALGKSEIRECGYPGIWRVTHWNAAGELIGRYLEVTFAPTLLASQPRDVRAGLERLLASLQNSALPAGVARA